MRRTASTLAAVALLTLSVVAPTGAASGPVLLKDINPSGSSNPSHMTVVGSTLFFAANDGVHGNELWKSDGTAAGTKMVKNIRPLGKSSNPAYLTAVGNTLFFMANDGVHGYELWKSDGTKAGTVLVKDINTGKKHSYGGTDTYIHDGGIFAVGSKLFFLVDFCCVGTVGLFVSDGTTAGTLELAGDPWIWMPENAEWWQEGLASSGAAGGKFYFVATESDWLDDFDLWVSDGTVAGTHTVAGAPTAEQMTVFPTNGGKLYFYTDRVWRTDGTAAGTKPLTAADTPSSQPTESAFLNSRLYFNGGGLWKTDGTVAGTTLISNGEVTNLVATSSRVYFTRGTDLWRSDGTVAGTVDIGAFGGEALTAVGTRLCFVDADWAGSTWNLWRSDGTAPGTYKVRSFGGVGESWQPRLAALGTRLFFAADDGSHGTELWSYTP